MIALGAVGGTAVVLATTKTGGLIEVHLDGATVINLLTAVIAVVLPLLVGLVTTKVTSPAKKGLTLIALSFVASVLNEVLTALVTQTPYDLIGGLIKWGGIALLAIGTYFGWLSRPDSSGTSVAARVATKGRHAAIEKSIAPAYAAPSANPDAYLRSQDGRAEPYERGDQNNTGGTTQ